jgi:hypothetical protein
MLAALSMVWYNRRNRHKARTLHSEAYATRLVLPAYSRFIMLVAAMSFYAFVIQGLVSFDYEGQVRPSHSRCSRRLPPRHARRRGRGC